MRRWPGCPPDALLVAGPRFSARACCFVWGLCWCAGLLFCVVPRAFLAGACCFGAKRLLGAGCCFWCGRSRFLARDCRVVVAARASARAVLGPAARHWLSLPVADAGRRIAFPAMIVMHCVTVFVTNAITITRCGSLSSESLAQLVFHHDPDRYPAGESNCSYTQIRSAASRQRSPQRRVAMIVSGFDIEFRSKSAHDHERRPAG